MRIVAIINQKGGCGKTTSAINLGACLAHAGKRVLVVDLDPQAHATLGFGMNPGSCHKSVYDLLVAKGSGSVDPRDAVISLNEHLDLIPSDVMLSTAEPLLIRGTAGSITLPTSLPLCGTEYDFTIIDCPRT